MEHKNADEDLSCAEVIYDYSRWALDSVARTFETLDQKAGNLVAFAGVLTALSLLGSDKVFGPPRVDVELLISTPIPATILLVAPASVLTALLASFVYALLAFRLRPVKLPPTASQVITSYRRKGSGTQRKRPLIKQLATAIVRIESQLMNICRQKADRVRSSWFFLAWAVTCLVIQGFTHLVILRSAKI